MNNINNSIKYTYLFLLTYIFVIPFYYYPATILFNLKIPVVKYFPLVLVAVLLIVSMANRSFRARLIKLNEFRLSVIVYLILALLSGLGTVYYPISAYKWFYYGLTGALIYFIVSSWDLSLEIKRYFLRLMVFLGFLVSLYGIITFVLGQDPFFGHLLYTGSNLREPEVWLRMGRISSAAGNPLFLGGILSLLFPLAIYFYLQDQGKRRPGNVFIAAQVVVIFLGLVLTFSIGALVSVIFFYFYYRHKTKNMFPESRSFKKTGIFLLFSLGCSCLLIFILSVNIFTLTRNNSYFFGNFLGKIDFHKLADIPSLVSRWNSLKFTAGFLGSPSSFFGVGLGKIGTGEFFPFRVSLDNYFCLSLVESGVFATAALLLVFREALKKGFKKTQDPLNVFLSASIIIFLINMLFFDALNQPVLRILLWSLIGFLI